jgi:hypothetical protein
MATVTVKCVGCGATREIGEGEIAPGETPVCEKCFSPMVATEARS